MTQQKYWTEELSFIAGVLLNHPGMQGEAWKRRHEVAHYLSLCMAKGFTQSENEARLCVDRYLAGKRKVTPPGTARRKRDAKERAQLMANLPAPLLSAVTEVIADNVKAVAQYRAGNDKALNALVGQVMKRYKSDAAVIKELLSIQVLQQ